MSYVMQLREKTGRGVLECKGALDACDGDLKLAQAYLMFSNLAVNVIPREGETSEQARHRWVMNHARQAINTI